MLAHRLTLPLAAALLLSALVTSADDTRAVEAVKPEAVGFSSERLQRLDQAMQAHDR